MTSVGKWQVLRKRAGLKRSLEGAEINFQASSETPLMAVRSGNPQGIKAF
jgi:hypothetical protein